MRDDLQFDPVTLEVIRHRLDTVAEEMETTLLKSSCSPLVKEGLDASASLFTLDGVTLAQACAIPIHLGTLIPAVGAILNAFPVAGMQEGDVYILNDPYLGGTHLPDVAVVMPVMAGGRPLALAATMTHHQDVGGKTAGSVPTDSTEIWQEGVRLPPLRWARSGVFDEGLTQILRLNTRVPDIFLGDLHAQIAACKVATMRLQETAARHGANVLPTAFDLLLARSEAMTRAALRRLPEGSWTFVDYLDNDGVDIDRRIRIEVTASLQDGEAHFDLTGTSEQVRGPVNCVPSGSLAAACYAVRAATDPTIPNNCGCFRPIRLTLPEGSLVNPRPPAPVNARTATIKRITGCMLGALAQAQPDRAPAPHAGELVVMAFGGHRRDGTGFVTGDLLAGGSGAAPDRDGVDAIETDATNCMNVPAESMELDAPIRVRRCELRRDTGGAGRFRGGLGLVKEFEILDDVCGPISFSHRGERHFHPAGGAKGGSPGGLAESAVLRGSGTVETIPSKLVTTLRPGDRVVVGTAGGGGWGAPAERDPEALAADVANGKIGVEAAETVWRARVPSEEVGS
jgi:N-methylhydantoinase B